MRNILLLFLSLCIGINLQVKAQRLQQSEFRTEATQLPEVVNNGKAKWFPPVFGQVGGSCGASSRIGYMMTYEWNAVHLTDASLLENQLPPHFQYPFSYSGLNKEGMAIQVGYPDGKHFGGGNVSSIYGFSEHTSDSFAWMQGYDNWYNTMLHRLKGTANLKESSLTESGAEAIKRWLFNHNGLEGYPTVTDENGTHIVGGVAGLGCGISSSELAEIPATAINTEAGVVGMHYIKHWNLGGYDHAITMVGYDDRIEFDLDADGVFGEASNEFGMNEKGAWICVNSWGKGYGDGGFFYVPYPLAGGLSEEVKYTPAGSTEELTAYRPKNGKGWTPEIYYINPSYKPERTLKLEMTYSKRSEISVQIGASQDLTATEPMYQEVFPYIHYRGDGNPDEDDQGVKQYIDAETPLLGRWADNKMHHEPMELGIDLSRVAKKLDTSKPIKYFLIIESKETANGVGEVKSASVIDYKFNSFGVETPIAEQNVSIKTQGAKTILTVVVGGEALNSPANLSLQNNELTWSAPMGTAYEPVKYFVYNKDNKIGETTETSYNLTDNSGVYSVKAVYHLGENDFVSKASNKVSSVYLTQAEALDNDVMDFSNGGFRIPNVTEQSHKQFTMEFWLKPKSKKNWNQQIGKGWNQFLFHYNGDGSLSLGWNGDNRINTAPNTLEVGQWQHIAVVIDDNKLMLYINGALINSLVSQNRSGLPKISDGFEVGYAQDGNNAINGLMDEFRFWSSARSQEELIQNMKRPIIQPAKLDDLLAYYKMDTIEVDGETLLKDWAKGNNAPFIGNSNTRTQINDTSQTFAWDNSSEISASIKLEDKIYANVPTALSFKSSLDIRSVLWSSSAINPNNVSVQEPTLRFTQVGEQTLTLTLTDIAGVEKTITKQVTVLPEPVVSADFKLTKTAIKGADRISFHALNKAPACTYKWTILPDANTQLTNTRSASANFNTIGTKTITLTVTSPDGTEYSQTKQIEVQLAKPEADFKLDRNVILKGESVQFTDLSKYQPDSWYWTASSKTAYLRSREQNPSFTFDKAGVYKVLFIPSNSEGDDPIERERVVIVCGADSQNGLSFASRNSTDYQTLTSSAVAGISNDFTLDYWFKPTALRAKANGIYGSNDSFTITSDTNGELTLKVDDHLYRSGANYYVLNEWHHYAIIKNGAKLSFYRDAELFSEMDITDTNLSDKLNSIRLGGSAQMDGVFDEFRLWSSSLAQNDLKKYSVEPIEGVELQKARDEKGLKLYYQFNQGSGLDVLDSSGNNNTGTRANAGPDGDAWRPSKGVFALDFSTVEVEAKPVGDLLSKETYAVSDYSDEEMNTEKYPVDYVLDGKAEAQYGWHSRWSSNSANYPHSVTIVRANVDEILGLKLVATRANNYKAGLVTIEQSEDAEYWSLIDKDYPLKAVNEQMLYFSKPVLAPYIRLTFTKGLEDSKFLFINELSFYGSAQEATKYLVPLKFVSCSSETADKGENVCDENSDSKWISESGMPQSLVLKNETKSKISMLSFEQSDNRSVSAGRINVLISNDGENFSEAIANLHLPYHEVGTVKLPKVISAQYIKLDFVMNQMFDGEHLEINEIQAFSNERVDYTPTSVAKLEGQSLKCYPNPSTDYVILEGASAGQTVRLYDMSGVLIKAVELKSSRPLKLDLSTLPKGWYLIRLANKSFKLRVR